MQYATTFGQAIGLVNNNNSIKPKHFKESCLQGIKGMMNHPLDN